MMCKYLLFKALMLMIKWLVWQRLIGFHKCMMFICKNHPFSYAVHCFILDFIRAYIHVSINMFFYHPTLQPSDLRKHRRKVQATPAHWFSFFSLMASVIVQWRHCWHTSSRVFLTDIAPLRCRPSDSSCGRGWQRGQGHHQMWDVPSSNAAHRTNDTHTASLLAQWCTRVCWNSLKREFLGHINDR